MNLKIKFIPYERFKRDGFKSLMHDLHESTIILIDAKLHPDEEAFLIEDTMKKISEKFSGIELSSMDFTKKDAGNFEKFRNRLIEAIIGKKRGMTIIGPAKLVHKIKKNPEELLLYV